MFFLGNYAVIPVMTVFLLLILVGLRLLLLDKLETLKSIKIAWISATTLLVSTMIFSYFLYHNQRDVLEEHFLKNGFIVCGYKDKSIIIKKDKNYTLKDDYFIKADYAIDIDSCKALKE